MLGLDFDGTLAPIVPDPDLARPDPALIGLLKQLSPRLRQLVLLSGRDTEVLERRVPVDAIRLIGNHGLEQSHAGRSSLSPSAEPFVSSLERTFAAIALIPEVSRAGVRVERKRAAISVHFRQAREPGIEARLEAALQPMARREGLRLHPGRFVWELRPAVDVNKGTVISGLAIELKPQAMVYVGDDLTDADAFRALRRLKGIKTVAVGRQLQRGPGPRLRGL